MNAPLARPLLQVRELTVEFATRNGTVQAVRRASFSVDRGETLGVVGESGSGKSVASYALMRILDRAGRIADGEADFSGVDLRRAPESVMAELRGREMSMIFQSPRTALNPIRKVGRQIADVLVEHAVCTRADAPRRAVELLSLVRIEDPERRAEAYPFQLSGGMCQRVVIALALACRPKLLIADEPTTGLDVMTQKAIMELIVELTRERGMSTILITHDLGLASAYCDRICVMERGEVVETAAAETIFAAPAHAYTRRLMRATPRPGVGLRDLLPDGDGRGALPPTEASAAPAPLLQVDHLVKAFSAEGRRAVDDVTFSVAAGESVGLVGESGCGKSTTSAMVMRLLDPSSGSILFDGQDIGAEPAARFSRHPLRAKLQMVFQDPTESLNPRFPAARCIADPLYRLGGVRREAEARGRAEELARLVGLPLDLLDRFPHQLSGGQKARVGIARAIALNPKLLLLDEPTAALDVSVQAVVLNLLADLKAERGMSYLFVSHDLHVVRLLCDRVIVMRAGRIVEQGPADEVMEAPSDPYTRELIAATPKPPV